MITLRIAQREFASFFRSSIGWVTIALYLLLSGFWIATVTLRPGEPATLRAYFGVSQWILLFIAPAISMRLMAEEWRAGTIETLMTAPISDWSLVAGKYLGAVAFYVAMLAPSVVYIALLEAVADPDYGPILAGYLGLMLAGMLYIAVGLFMSSLTDNQIVALLATVFFFIILELAAIQGARFLGPPWDERLYAFSPLLRIADLAKGVIDTAHLAAIGAACAWFLVLTVVTIESRRWR